MDKNLENSYKLWLIKFESNENIRKQNEYVKQAPNCFGLVENISLFVKPY